MKNKGADMQPVINYLLRFLLGEGNEAFASAVSYGASENAAVVIRPSHFFAPEIYLTPESIPQLPLPELEGVPVLYGEPRITEEQGQTILHADLIASAFFLLTRYEECVKREQRDPHGRFPVEQSLPMRAGFLQRPIVEEYAVLLRDLLRKQGVPVQEPPIGFSRIYLTHDVDCISTWHGVLPALRSTIKRVALNLPEKAVPFASLCHLEADPIYTFPWLLELDGALAASLSAVPVEQIYFLVGAPRGALDDEYLDSERFQKILHLLKSHGVTFGLHNSYQASRELTRTAAEKRRIESVVGTPITCNRCHVLASREPEDMRALADAGITDDFTMAYAGHIGFRLGTCRAVRWIDPVRRELTSLTLHPMTTMDCTLDRYMGLPDAESALAAVTALLRTIHRYHGEVCLLWHNSAVPTNDTTYQRRLYPMVLNAVSDVQRLSD